MKFVKFEGTVEELKAAYPMICDAVAQPPEVKTSAPLQPTPIPLAQSAETEELTEEAVVDFFTRRPLTKTHSALIGALFDAPEDGVGLTTTELAKLINCPSETVKGSMRAFGKRVAHTKTWPSDLQAFDRKWLGSENVYRLHPAVRDALKSGRVKV